MTHMTWQAWTACALVGLTASWMAFDGARALLTGDYVTPRSGPSAGQLGPWSKVLALAGLDPRSTAVKAFFVAYGAGALAAMACLLLGFPWARPVLIAMAALGLWYLPVGTVLNAAAILLLLSAPHRMH